MVDESGVNTMKTTPGSPAEASSGGPASLSAAPRILVLVGFMGAGKTSVGRALGRQLGWTFEDLDDRIQAREKRSVEQIFRDSGETEFRRAEHQALQELLLEAGSGPRVVALGGGAFVQADNAVLLQQAGIVVAFLDAPAEELYRRCEQEQRQRPLRQDREQFRALYQSRRPYYAAGTLRIETTDKDVEAVATELARNLGLG
jgi:shikimate kinase